MGELVSEVNIVELIKRWIDLDDDTRFVHTPNNRWDGSNALGQLKPKEAKALREFLDADVFYMYNGWPDNTFVGWEIRTDDPGDGEE